MQEKCTGSQHEHEALPTQFISTFSMYIIEMLAVSGMCNSSPLSLDRPVVSITIVVVQLELFEHQINPTACHDNIVAM